MVWRPFYTAGPRAQASACSMGPPASAQLTHAEVFFHSTNNNL